MSLRAKVVLILSAIVLLYAALDHAIQRLVVYRSFVELEEAQARRDVERVVEAFEAELDEIDGRCLDWAAREDTVRYVRRPSPEFETAYLTPTSQRESGFDALFLLREDGIALWSRVLERASGRELDLRRTLPRGGLAPTHPLLRRPPGEERSAVRGLFLTEAGPMMACSRPILEGGLEGERRGWIVVGRFLDEALRRDIRRRTAVDFELVPPPDESAPEPERALWDRVASAPIDVGTDRPAPVLAHAEDGDEVLDAWATLEDVKRAPGILVHARIPRAVTRQGATAVRYALLSTVAAGLLMMLVLLLVLQRTVIAPIGSLTAHAVRIGRSDDFTVKSDIRRADEIGVLSREFDGMMEKLDRSRKALVDAARRAGMSEIASGILHNVGNVLNSVNVSTTLIARKARDSRVKDLERVLGAAAAHPGGLSRFVSEHPKGAQLQPLLEGLARELEGERRSVLAEVEALEKGVEHIKQLVASQESFATRESVREVVRVEELLERSVELSEQAMGAPDGARIVYELEPLPALRLDRHRVLQVLVNLVQNARQALLEARTPDPTIVLRGSCPRPDRLVLEVEDNGPGIPPENFARIFNHGFTTKAGGHGFGLHASSNAATELGGALHAHSEVLGRGARFVLEIPVEIAAAVAAA